MIRKISNLKSQISNLRLPFQRAIKNHVGFTLIELIVAFSIISILSTIGLASFVNYSNSQVLQGSVSDFISTINVAKARAASQLKPTDAGCSSNTVLDGYGVVLNSATAEYSLYANCSGNVYDIGNPVALAKGISFNSDPQLTTTTNVFFSVLTSGIQGTGMVEVDGTGTSPKCIIISDSGIVQQTGSCSVISPTPAPTSAPTQSINPTSPPTSCNSPYTLCNGVCTNMQTDSNNCGRCGYSCGTGNLCNNGSCIAGNSYSCQNNACVNVGSGNGFYQQYNCAQGANGTPMCSYSATVVWGYVYVDLNSNGHYDIGEGYNNANIILTSPSGSNTTLTTFNMGGNGGYWDGNYQATLKFGSNIYVSQIKLDPASVPGCTIVSQNPVTISNPNIDQRIDFLLSGCVYTSPTPTLIPTSTPTPAPITDYYVSTTGNDNNPGTQALPFATINKASTVVKPGNTVHVLSGTYSHQSISTSASGTSTSRITYISDTPLGAKLVENNNPNSYTTDSVWQESGNYVTIKGFDVSGGYRIGILNRGSSVTISNNYVHGNAASYCSSSGGAGIDSTGGSSNLYTMNLVVGNGAYKPCSYVHGIYMQGASETTTNNLIINNAGLGVACTHSCNAPVIANNHVLNNGYGIKIGASTYGIVTNNAIVSNNIVAYSASGYAIYENFGTVSSNAQYLNNLFYQNQYNSCGLYSGATCKNTIVSNPQMVNYQGNGSGNYRLNSSSPAVNAGTSTGAPGVDYDGNSRPIGSAYDIGAYEQ